MLIEFAHAKEVEGHNATSCNQLEASSAKRSIIV